MLKSQNSSLDNDRRIERWPDLYMKLTRRIRFTTLAVVLGLSFGLTFHTMADQWFDSYNKIPWKNEIVRLKNLKYFLENNPETIGCIIYRWTDKNDKKEMSTRAERARRYLIHELNVEPSRIVVIDGKQTLEGATILQPVPKGAQLPTF